MVFKTERERTTAVDRLLMNTTEEITCIELEVNGENCNLSIEFWLGGCLSQSHRATCVRHVTKADFGYVETLCFHADLCQAFPDRPTVSTHTYTHLKRHSSLSAVLPQPSFVCFSMAEYQR